MQQAIEQMSNELRLPINLAKVNQIDLATHFIMNRPIPEYYPYLGSKRYFKRLQATNDTLYYNTSARQFIFYNKLKEAKSKGVIIPEVYRNEYLLRYESKKGLPCPKVLFKAKKEINRFSKQT